MDLKIKICGITNAADALAAVAAGADALGFMFYAASPRSVTVEAAVEIAAKVPPHVLRVGVFVNPSDDLVSAAVLRCGLGLLQFHGEEEPGFCRQFGIMSMKAFRIKDADSLQIIPSYQTDAYLLDSYVAGRAGGTGEKFNWDLALEVKKLKKPIFLAGGLTAENVAKAVRWVQPFAVDVSSGVEASPGKKDHQKMRDFIQAARSAAAD